MRFWGVCLVLLVGCSSGKAASVPAPPDAAEPDAAPADTISPDAKGAEAGTLAADSAAADSSPAGAGNDSGVTFGDATQVPPSPDAPPAACVLTFSKVTADVFAPNFPLEGVCEVSNDPTGVGSG